MSSCLWPIWERRVPVSHKIQTRRFPMSFTEKPRTRVDRACCQFRPWSRRRSGRAGSSCSDRREKAQHGIWVRLGCVFFFFFFFFFLNLHCPPPCVPAVNGWFVVLGLGGAPQWTYFSRLGEQHVTAEPEFQPSSESLRPAGVFYAIRQSKPVQKPSEYGSILRIQLGTEHKHKLTTEHGAAELSNMCAPLPMSLSKSLSTPGFMFVEDGRFKGNFL